MGKKRPSIRTLPSGEKAVHTPDGRMTLITENRMLAALEAQSQEIAAAEADRQALLLESIADKQASLDAGDAVPHDKRPI